MFDHNAVGNLLSETVTGRTGRNVSYAYGQNGAPPHALTTRNGQAYSHDGGGRRIAGAALGSIIYNRRNLPIRIQRNSGVTVEMAYDAAGTRVLKRTADSSRYSVGGLFERTIGSDVRNQHYIVAEGRPVAEVVHIQEAPEGAVVAKETRYLHSDGQGSAVLVTDESGATVAELFYDPFGRRTEQNYDPLAGTVPVRPGYTGHLHDDELDLIDMKGRVYDIETRRFLTPDPFIPAPLFSQSHNRYSYVWNNPATLVNPTGFHPDDFETETTCFFIVCWSNSTASDGGTSGGGSVGDGGSSTNGVSTTVPQQPAAATPNSSDASVTTPFDPQGSGGEARPWGIGSWPGVGGGYSGGSSGYPACPACMPKNSWSTPGWITDLEQRLSELGRYAGWSHGPGAVGTWSAAVDSTVAGALSVDRLAGVVPLGGTLYHAAQGRWREAGTSALTDLIAFGAARALRAGGVGSSYVYQLIDDAGEPVYYGVAGDPAVRLGRHALQPPGPFRGMQVISGPLPPPQALILETSLIHQARAEERFIYNIADTSLSPPVLIRCPTHYYSNADLAKSETLSTAVIHGLVESNGHREHDRRWPTRGFGGSCCRGSRTVPRGFRSKAEQSGVGVALAGGSWKCNLV